MNLPEDPFVRELLPEFVETWINDINMQFDGYITNLDSEGLYRMAHTLKGSCYQFCLDDIAGLGIELMGYAKASDWEKAKSMKSPILESFVKVKTYIEENGIV